MVTLSSIVLWAGFAVMVAAAVILVVVYLKRSKSGFQNPLIATGKGAWNGKRSVKAELSRDTYEERHINRCRGICKAINWDKPDLAMQCADGCHLSPSWATF